ncbi:MAG TPA: nickel pincer cofactor biosynthesis protein LarC, partial [Phycisphaerae bacterium]|nr:nickel pincer cofactor biosynthesis protein LarC [Phycisphaerae bacterium]
MKIAYFDCFAGAAGDMIAASLIHAGADIMKIESRLSRLGLAGYDIECGTLSVQGISAMRFKVNVDGSEKPHRHLSHIVEIIKCASLGKNAEGMAIKIFTNLAKAESQVHNTTIDNIHFHEVGAVDSIIDIVTAAVALDELGIQDVFCSAIPLGSGTIRCDHGIMPVPAPATARLLADAHAATVPGPNTGEATTPTAAAILTTLCKNIGTMPAMTVTSTGYGAGSRQDGPAPNLLRVIIGETTSPDEGDCDCVLELSANIDDISGEIIGAAIDSLMQAGALDAWASPIYTKKNRPAWT